MSLATNIKEFADVLHNVYAQQLSSVEGTNIVSDGVLPLAIPKLLLLQQACLYAAKSFSSAILYFLGFQWLRDFSYLPLISPEIGTDSSVNHDTFLSEPFSYLFSFAKNGVFLSRLVQGEAGGGSINLPLTEELYAKPGGLALLFNGFLKTDQLLAGFVNSFFFSLPLSLPHLISLRRMFSQGAVAAAASIFGSVAAHSLLIIGSVYGIRFLIVPYYSLQPATFSIAIVAIAIVITEFVKEKRVYLVPVTHYPSLVRIFALNFLVALGESATVFHDLHHLTLNQQVSYLQLYESQNGLDSFFVHLAYLVSFILGHVFFSLLFCFSLLKLAEKVCSLSRWTLPQTARRINRALLIAILTLTFSAFPYYGLDYLFTKSVGFLPEDPVYRNTIFSPTQVRSRNRHFKSRAPATKNSKTPLELDLNYFDRGMYLNAPREEKMQFEPHKSDAATSLEIMNTYDPALTFEELNYRGESAWLMRHERARRLPEEPDSKKLSVFQEQKTHFKQLKSIQENKQARAALREGSQIGSVSGAKEGKRWNETLRLNDLKAETISNNRYEGPSVAGKVQPSTGPLHQKESIDHTKTSKGEREQLSRELPRAVFSPSGSRGESVTKLYANSLEAEKGGERKALLKELAFEKEIASNYEKSFASAFGEDSDGTPPDLLPVENIIKKRYRLNPVYRALLQTDIDFFIARQPSDYKITQNQEANLFKKRQLLEKYYNSVRYYSPVEAVLFTQRYQGDRKAFLKSFGQTTYHQQFKGTVNTVKKFFKLSFDEQQNSNPNRVLTYDQALYKAERETLQNKTFPVAPSADNATKEGSYHPSLHEELSFRSVLPFIEESNSAPIYAGWDEKARRFVITNRFAFIS